MEQLVKGSHAPKVRATCEQCGHEFERSAVHPYIVKCPDCRGGVRAARKVVEAAHKRVRCKACRELISQPLPLGPHTCVRYGKGGGCEVEWWSVGGGWVRNTATDDVFRLGEFMGSLREATFDEVFRGVREDVPVKLS